MRIISYILLVSCCGSLLSCIERTDHDHQSASVPESQLTEDWQLDGEFGGDAKVINKSSDPWQVRFSDDGFKLVSGICATDDEIWVCDLGISRIQVFGFDGRFRRSIGDGVQFEGTLPSLEEVYLEAIDHDRDTDVLWEEEHGNQWRANRRGLFRAADVAVSDTGYWIADWVVTGAKKSAYRSFAVYYVPDEGDIRTVEISGLAYPSYLTAGESDVAVASPITSGLFALDWQGGNWKVTGLNNGLNFQRYMQIEHAFADNSDYINVYRRQAGCGQDSGQYFLASGTAIAFEKLLICDTGNRRIQVLNLNRDKDWTYAMVARVIRGETDHEFRFSAPLDIDVTADGRMFVLDSDRCEVAILDAGFNRIGTFGSGDLVDPYALDLSDDDRHCFVSDRRSNKVFHYVDAS